MSNTATANDRLGLPRLVLRLGGLGNRAFGDAQGITGDAARIQECIRAQIELILNALEDILLELQRKDLDPDAYHWPQPLSWWKRLLGLLLFNADRWGLETLRGQPQPVFAADPPLIQLLTGDAQGTDRMLEGCATARRDLSGTVAWEVLHVCAVAPQEVSAGLGIGRIPDRPLTAATAEQPLSREESATRVLAIRQRAMGFRAQSEALRHHSDLLIAVWDPDAEGKPGGTAESVANALREGVAVVALRVRGEGTCEISVLTRHEQLHSPPAAFEPDDWRTCLREVVFDVLSFPDPDVSHESGGHDAQSSYHPRAAFHRFRDARPPDRIWTERLWLIYASLRNFLGAYHALRTSGAGRGQHFTLGSAAELKNECWTSLKQLFQTVAGQFRFFRTAAQSPALSPPQIQKENRAPTFADWYQPARRRAASSGMSGVYGDAHRGGILASYVLAATAVILAVIGGVLHGTSCPAWAQAGIAAVELLTIILMYSIAEASRLENWNTAYTESRILAEALRMMDYLGPLGVHTPLPLLPYYLRGDSATPTPERMWSVWYFRALVRTAPLRLFEAGTGSLSEHRAKLEALVTEQQQYHHRNANRQLAVQHAVEVTSDCLVLLVFLCVAVHIVDLASGLHLLNVAVPLIICVGAPAMIAALHGLASQMEIARLRQRSTSVATLLQEQYGRIQRLDLETHPEGVEAVWGYTAEVLATSSLLMDETAGWSMLYRNSNIHAG